jgi:arylsulfatase A-like enzyme
MVRNDLVNYGHRYTEQEYATSPEMTLGLDVDEVTIGEDLWFMGYTNGMIGKWDMGQARRFLPLQNGFDYFYGFGNNGIDYYTHERYGIHSMFRGNQRTKADQGIYATDLFEREALHFLRDAAEGPALPWFLYLCFNAPHGASSFGTDPKDPNSRAGVQAPDEYVAKYAGLGLSENLQRYYAAVTRMDAAIGKILNHLRSTEQEANTIVIFLSDNGGSGNGGNAPLRGAKSTLWEGGLRVPCIVRWPNKIPANRVSDAFLTTLELRATALAVNGEKVPEWLDGFDMIPVLQGKAPSPRKEMFWEFRGQKAARVGNYKWIESERAKGLYDLSTDIGEKNDLTAAMPGLAADIRTRWANWRKEMEQAEPRGPFRDY